MVDLRALKRRELQALAKEHGIRANQRSAVLVEKLEKKIRVGVERSSSASQGALGAAAEVATLAREQTSGSNDSTERDDFHDVVEDDDETEVEVNDVVEDDNETEVQVNTQTELETPSIVQEEVPVKVKAEAPYQGHVDTKASVQVRIEDSKENTTVMAADCKKNAPSLVTAADTAVDTDGKGCTSMKAVAKQKRAFEIANSNPKAIEEQGKARQKLKQKQILQEQKHKQTSLNMTKRAKSRTRTIAKGPATKAKPRTSFKFKPKTGKLKPFSVSLD